MFRFAACALLPLVMVGCAKKDETGAGQSKGYEIVSPVEVRIEDGATAQEIIAEDGSVRAVSVTARINGGVTYITCECMTPGCGGNCRIEREDPTGSTVFRCVGSCSNSEGSSCGACVTGESPNPPSPSELERNLGVDPSDEPQLEPGPN